MPNNPIQRAWVVLWAAFITFCALAVLIPFVTDRWLRTSTEAQVVELTSSGTVLVQRPNRDAPEAGLTVVPIGSIITTARNAQATLTILSPDRQDTLASVQIYGESRMILELADSPQFTWWSQEPHRLRLRLENGRLRAFNTGVALRSVEITIQAPPSATILLNARGSNAAVDASFTGSNITVGEGEATVLVGATGQVLAPGQRAEVAPNLPLQIFQSTERNLITDGEFQQPLGVFWQTDIRAPSDSTQDAGNVQIQFVEGRRAASFLRIGEGWSQVGLRQEINRDVRDFRSLKLQLDVLLRFQDLTNCGGLGTECPVIVRLEYEDINGNPREFLQGFFYRAAAGPNAGATRCVQCSGAVVEHQRLTEGQWQTYESQNLIELFNTANAPVTVIKAVTVYASGHSYESSVAQVRLLASD